MAEYAVRDIAPNPFRHLDKYPIRRDKVDALRESIRTTGFWDNLIARSNGSGKPEIAYGHHRLVALREELGPNEPVKLNIRKLDDENMIQIMARENAEEWSHEAGIEHETVRAVVQAYADGLIELETPGALARAVRYAPSFLQGSSPADDDQPYTASEIAKFLGWGTDKVQNALAALELIEEGVLAEDTFDGLGAKQARAVITEARRVKKRREEMARELERQAEQAENERQRAALERAAEKEREKAHDEAAAVGEGVSEALREGEIGTAQARDEAAKYAKPAPEPEIPDINKFINQESKKLAGWLNGDKTAEHLDAVVEFRANATKTSLRVLVGDLRALGKRAEGYAHKLEKPVSTAARQKALTAGRKGR